MPSRGLKHGCVGSTFYHVEPTQLIYDQFAFIFFINQPALTVALQSCISIMKTPQALQGLVDNRGEISNEIVFV
jgi:hypothetical protein